MLKGYEFVATDEHRLTQIFKPPRRGWQCFEPDLLKISLNAILVQAGQIEVSKQGEKEHKESELETC
jgi:hypothetical protein